MDELAAVLHVNDIDLCCITESNLNGEIPTEAVDIDGYICYRRDRSDGRQWGGVACYVRSELTCREIVELHNDDVESLWLLFRAPRMPRSLSHIGVGIIYHPPDASSSQTTSHIIDSIDQIVSQHPYSGILIAGDFNKMNERPLQNYPLKQIVKSKTRGNSTLDKIFTNIALWYSNPVVLPSIARSDHQSVVIRPTTNANIRGHRVITTLRSNDFSRKTLMAHALADFNWQTLYSMTSIDDMVEYFNNTIMYLLDYFLPTRTVVRHSNDKPWVTDEFRRLIRQRQYAWTHGEIPKYRQLRNKINRLSARLRQKYCEKRLTDLRNTNSSSWWRITKQLTGQSSKHELTGLANELTDGNIHHLADIINTFLTNVSSDLKPIEPLPENLRHATVSSQHIVHAYEVFDKLSRINVRKASGPDNIPNWTLRDFAFAITEPLTFIFNVSIASGIVPDIWKMANITPLAKTHPPKSLENDIRPISLTCTLSKLLESIIGKWVLDAISPKIDPKQFGGIKGRSTSHALIDILHNWHEALDKRNSVRAVFVDYAKAFDHVDHNIVMSKMRALDVPEDATRWLHSFLSERQQRVKIGNIVSNWSSANGGMPQGTWLGPYVFIALINDLKLSLPVHKFVDDTTITELNTNGSDNMTLAIAELATWSRENHMNINSRKTKVMQFGNIPRTAPPSQLIIADQVIERVLTFKLLGVMISNDLKWHSHVEYICAKASKRLHFLKLLKRASLSPDDLLYFYKSIIRPVVEYASAVWNSSINKGQRAAIERIQTRALKIIHSNMDADDALTYTNLESLDERRSRLSQHMFNSMLNQNNCLHHLLPNKRDNVVIDRLRHSHLKYEPLRARTTRYQNSFLPYALRHYQSVSHLTNNH